MADATDVPGRVLALDLGARRTGVAISDPLRIAARPLIVLEHQGATLVARVAELVRDQGAVRVVVGLPLLPSGDWTDQARGVARFAARLEAALDVVPVELWDESYTTLEASARRRARGVARGSDPTREAPPLDAEAAAVILEEWLASAASPGASGEASGAAPDKDAFL